MGVNAWLAQRWTIYLAQQVTTGGHATTASDSISSLFLPWMQPRAASCFRDRVPFTVWSQVLSSITEAGRELSRCPPHSGSQSASLLGIVVSFCPLLSLVPHQTPGNYEKCSSASYRRGHRGYFDRSTTLSHSPGIAHSQLWYRCAQGSWYLRFSLGNVNESDFTWWVTRGHCMEPALTQERSYCCYIKHVWIQAKDLFQDNFRSWEVQLANQGTKYFFI